MIQRIVKYVDENGNGEVDIAELDKAFRLSRIQVDEAIEGQHRLLSIYHNYYFSSCHNIELL